MYGVATRRFEVCQPWNQPYLSGAESKLPNVRLWMGFPPPTSQQSLEVPFDSDTFRKEKKHRSGLLYSQEDPGINLNRIALIQFHVFLIYFTQDTKQHCLCALPDIVPPSARCLPRAPQSELAGVCHLHRKKPVIGQNRTAHFRQWCLFCSTALHFCSSTCGGTHLIVSQSRII